MSDDELIKMKLGGHDPVKITHIKKLSNIKDDQLSYSRELLRDMEWVLLAKEEILHTTRKLNEDELLYFKSV